jgi:hypothetical protein
VPKQDRASNEPKVRFPFEDLSAWRSLERQRKAR